MKDIVHLLDINLPVLQAPLPFYLEQVALAIQASNLGALGVIDVCTLLANDESPAIALADLISDSKLRASNGVALVFDMRVEQAENGVTLDTFLRAVSDDPVRAVLFRHGVPDIESLRQLKRVGIPILAIASNVLEAIACDTLSLDAIVLQGLEAGGIHSRFDNDLCATSLPAHSLLQQTRPLVTKPLILWGEIISSASVVAALVNGAQAVMVDTPLWVCADSPLPEAIREQVRLATEVDTIFDNGFTKNTRMGFPCRYLPYVKPIIPAENTDNDIHQHNKYSKSLQLWQRKFSDHSATLTFAGLSATVSEKTMSVLLSNWEKDLNAILGNTRTESSD